MINAKRQLLQGGCLFCRVRVIGQNVLVKARCKPSKKVSRPIYYFSGFFDGIDSSLRTLKLNCFSMAQRCSSGRSKPG